MAYERGASRCAAKAGADLADQAVGQTMCLGEVRKWHSSPF